MNQHEEYAAGASRGDPDGAGDDLRAPSRSAYHHGNLREALVEEAKKVLETDGLDALSLRGLARRLGVSHAAPSHHFADRAALLAELAADGFATLADRLEVVAAEGLGWAGAGMVLVDLALEKPAGYRLLFCSGITAGSPPSQRLRVEATRAYRSLMTAVGCDRDSVDEAAPFGDSGLLGCLAVPQLSDWVMIHGAICLFLDGGADLDGQEFRQLARGMLTGRR